GPPKLWCFEWDLTVLDAPGMEDTILGHEFLVYWNSDVDWQEGLDDKFPPGDLQYPDSSPSSLSSSDHRVIAYCSNITLPNFFKEKAEPSIKGFFIKDDKYIEDLETIIKTLLPVAVYFPIQQN
ncbi:hypothetical protein VP01_6153g1, partial [Puccinia sorghi]